MNAKLIFKVLAVVVTVEIFYTCITSTAWWSYYLTYPQFCTSFTNGQGNCPLDYSESAESFLQRYEKFCEENFIVSDNISSLPPCSCIPDVVKRDNQSEVVLYETSKEGVHLPKDCVARQRVAIIIPYRNRRRHLKTLLRTLHQLLAKQNLAYKIFVIEQNRPAIFNKAMLMNSGYLEASQSNEFDCFIFHDVDMIPIDPRNFYVCLDLPRHVGGFIQIYDFKLLYPALFGGVTAFRKEQFQALNGFSNQYYGWGGEDDDILQRILSKDMKVNRFPPSVSKYNMIIHHGDPGNPGNINRHSGFLHNPAVYKVDGLNSINYTIDIIQEREGYTRIFVSLPEPPKTLKTYDRSRSTMDELQSFFNWFLLFTAVVVLSLFVIYHSSSM